MEICHQLEPCFELLNQSKTGRELLKAAEKNSVSISVAPQCDTRKAGQYDFASREVTISERVLPDLPKACRILAREMQHARQHLQLGTLKPPNSYEHIGRFMINGVAAKVDAEAVAAVVIVEIVRSGHQTAPKSEEPGVGSSASPFRVGQLSMVEVRGTRTEIYDEHVWALLEDGWRIGKYMKELHTLWQTDGNSAQISNKTVEEIETAIAETGRLVPKTNFRSHFIQRVQHELDFYPGIGRVARFVDLTLDLVRDLA